MASKQGYGADLKNYVDKRIQINLNGNRKLIGKLKGYDPFMNIVLENTIDITNNNTKMKEEEKRNTPVLQGSWHCPARTSSGGCDNNPRARG